MRGISPRAIFCGLLALLHAVIGVGALPVVLCIAASHTAIELAHCAPVSDSRGHETGAVASMALSLSDSTCRDVRIEAPVVAVRDPHASTSSVTMPLLPALDLTTLLAASVSAPAQPVNPQFGFVDRLSVSARSLRSVVLLV